MKQFKRRQTVICWKGGLILLLAASLNACVEPGNYNAPISDLTVTSASLPPMLEKTSSVVPSKETGLHFQWPVSENLINKVSHSHEHNGIDIFGEKGQPIYAAGSGDVIYSGLELAEYGKLIIIKHKADFLTAYAHNDVLLVKEGEHVQAGTLIAKMGKSKSEQVMLHFEIRQKGKPEDPLRYLPARQ